MLTDFFHLNDPFDEFHSFQELKSALRNSNDLRNVAFYPNKLTSKDLERQRSLFTKITFTNVSFSKTEISDVTFQECKFVDCLFIDTRFEDSEFHQCTFRGCNPHKAEFNNTYIDPEVFVGMIDKKKYPNVGIYLFQQLYKNSMSMGQTPFARIAEFNVRKWERYNLKRKYRGQNKSKWGYFRDWSTNIFSYLVTGYGIRARFWISWAILIGMISVCFNYLFWDYLDVAGRDGTVAKYDLIEVLFYTVTTFVGRGILAPGSDFGKLAFIVQTCLGLFMVGVFLRWIMRLVVR